MHFIESRESVYFKVDTMCPFHTKKVFNSFAFSLQFWGLFDFKCIGQGENWLFIFGQKKALS